MASFSSAEYQIGRGETAESQVEAPIFAAFAVIAAIGVLFVHIYFKNSAITVALAVSLLIFGVTMMRVDWGVYFLVIAMMLSPEIGEGDVGTARRAVNLRYDDVLIIVVFFGVLFKNAYENRGTLWLPSPINSGIVFYFGCCLFSTMLAFRASIPLFDKKTSMFVLLKMLEYYMVFVFVGTAIRTNPQIRKQLTLFFVVALIVAVFGIHARQFTEEARVSSPFEQGGSEPNTLGGYLTIVTLLAAGLFTQAPTRKLKILFFGLGLLTFFPLLFTLSRASYIAIIVGFVVLALIAKKHWMVAALVIVLLLSKQIMPTDVQDRVSNTFIDDGKEVQLGEYETGITVDKSTHERIYVWEKVRYNLRVWPFFGGGVAWDRVLDSQYARVIIESGLVGFAAFVMLQLRILKGVRQSYLWAEDWVGRGLGIAVFAITFALIAHSMGTISFLIVRIMEPYWFLVALAMVVRHNAIEGFHRKKTEDERLAPHVRRATPATAITATQMAPTSVRPHLFRSGFNDS